MTDWTHAACVGHDPEMWVGDNRYRHLLAAEICQTCPIQDECYQYAQRHDVRGVWGGILLERPDRIRVCDWCGAVFDRQNKSQKYCTRACSGSAHNAQRQLDPRPCAMCTGTFTPSVPTDRFCSFSCTNASKYAPRVGAA